MESAGLRRRAREARRTQQAASDTAGHAGGPAPSPAEHAGEGRRALADDSRRGPEPPRFTIDLSLAPEERYGHIVPRLADRISGAALAGLFDDLVGAAAPPAVARWLRLLARHSLRRVRSPEETRELRGIAAASGVPMYLLVAFNVLLDLLLGCTSGGVRVGGGGAGAGGGGSRVLHFRTLDWGMDPLRKIVVELDFVRRAGGPVVATSVTYFGYVGVLTGVRPGLSMSLNFRPRHDRSTWRSRFAFRLYQMMVVLGLRPGISSTLRGFLLSPEYDRQGDDEGARGGGPGGDGDYQGPVQGILAQLAEMPSTAAYLVFCTPGRVYSVEKDYRAAAVRESDTFLTTCNHDAADESDPPPDDLLGVADGEVEHAIGMSELIAYSTERKRRIDDAWRRSVNRRIRKTGTRSKAIGVADVLRLVEDPEVSNEETHYAVIMDPAQGTVLWRRVFDVEAPR